MICRCHETLELARCQHCNRAVVHLEGSEDEWLAMPDYLHRQQNPG
jgi:hypothetical protein